MAYELDLKLKHLFFLAFVFSRCYLMDCSAVDYCNVYIRLSF